MLIFRDSILGFVSGLQLAANDLCCKVGDWISVPKYGADGNVEEVSLTTVKIRNWDNTLVMLPPYLLTTDSFTNWHAMQAFGWAARALRGDRHDERAFLHPRCCDHYRKIDLLRDYIDRTERSGSKPITRHGIAPGDGRSTACIRPTWGCSAPTWCAIWERSSGKQDMTLMVRQLQRSRPRHSAPSSTFYRYGGVGGDTRDSVGCLRSRAGLIPEFGAAGVPESPDRMLRRSGIFFRTRRTPVRRFRRITGTSSLASSSKCLPCRDPEGRPGKVAPEADVGSAPRRLKHQHQPE